MTLNILWFFFIYAFFGWCTEVVYAAVGTGEFVNRGFLNGPYCPIYGVGVISIIYLLDPVKNNILYLFLGCVLITSAIELIGGFLLERIFHHKWWDYSDTPFNIGGYICLKFSLIWGLACLVVVDRIHPIIIFLVHMIPQTVSLVLLVIFAGLFIVDSISTVRSILKLNRQLEIIDEITLKIRETSDNLGEILATDAIEIVHMKDYLVERFESKKETIETDISSDLHMAYKELLEAISFGQKRLLKAFPELISVNHKEALVKLRNSIK